MAFKKGFNFSYSSFSKKLKYLLICFFKSFDLTLFCQEYIKFNLLILKYLSLFDYEESNQLLYKYYFKFLHKNKIMLFYNLFKELKKLLLFPLQFFVLKQVFLKHNLPKEQIQDLDSSCKLLLQNLVLILLNHHNLLS